MLIILKIIPGHMKERQETLMQTSDVLVNPHLPVQSHKQFELWEVGIKLTVLLNTLLALQTCHTIINIVILVYFNFCEEFNTQV